MAGNFVDDTRAELLAEVERARKALEPRYEPAGIRFVDKNRGVMLLITEGEYKDWVCFKHPDGQWVTERKATDDERATLYRACGFAEGVGA